MKTLALFLLLALLRTFSKAETLVLLNGSLILPPIGMASIEMASRYRRGEFDRIVGYTGINKVS